MVIIPTEALERITKTVYYTAAAPDGTFKLRMDTGDPFQLWAARGREATSDDYDLKLVVNSSGWEVDTEWSYEVFQIDANATFIHIFGGKAYSCLFNVYNRVKAADESLVFCTHTILYQWRKAYKVH